MQLHPVWEIHIVSWPLPQPWHEISVSKLWYKSWMRTSYFLELDRALDWNLAGLKTLKLINLATAAKKVMEKMTMIKKRMTTRKKMLLLCLALHLRLQRSEDEA